jgi:integrase
MKRYEKSLPPFPYTVEVEGVTAKIYQAKKTRVYKGRRYNLFVLAYRAGGKRRLKAFARFKDAKQRAQEILFSIARDKASVLALNGADVQSYIAARKLLEPFGIPLHEAVEQFVAMRQRDSGNGDKSVGALVDEFLGEKEQSGLSKRYTETLQSHLKRFAGSFHTNVASVTTSALQQWLLATAKGLRSRNNVRASIVSLFHFARARGYLPKHRTTEADDLPKAKDRGGNIQIFSPREMTRLMKKAQPQHRLYFALAGFAGIRRAEIERLEWSDFNFQRATIEVGKHKAKTATRRLVPIAPNLMEWLRPFKGETGRLFPRRRIVENAIDAAKANGVQWKQNALRHSYASYRLTLIADAGRVSLEMGTSAQKLFSNYRELAHEYDAKAWFAIGGPKRPRNVVEMRVA